MQEITTDIDIIPKRQMPDLIENGIIIVNKHKGATSHCVAEQVKKIIGCKKTGHCGTLDPNVCGVLVLTLNNATKISSLITKQGKDYICLMKLHKTIDLIKLKSVFEKYTGCINQMPPVKSAVKRQLRKRNVYELKIIEMKNRNVLFFAHVEAGFYMRKLCSDIGDTLGCGANMLKLLRTKAGNFSIEEAHSTIEIKQIFQKYKSKKKQDYLRKIILPLECGLKNIPKIIVSDNSIFSLCNGVPLFPPGVVEYTSNIVKNNIVVLLNTEYKLIAIATANVSANEIPKQTRKRIASIKRVIKVL